MDLVLQRLNKQANNSLSYADGDNNNNNDNNDDKTTTTTTTQYLSIQSIQAINNILKVTSYRSAKTRPFIMVNTNNTISRICN